VSETVRPEPRRNVYEERFWEFVEKHDLRLQKCSECGTFRYPPSGVCHRCLSDAYDWIPLSGRGTILSWVVFHRQYFPEIPVPYTVVAVETEEGPILITDLVHADGADPRVGRPVRLCYETALKRSGERWQIYQFELA
jgi:uncharacterized OB-fold protein